MSHHSHRRNLLFIQEKIFFLICPAYLVTRRNLSLSTKARCYHEWCLAPWEIRANRRTSRVISNADNCDGLLVKCFISLQHYSIMSSFCWRSIINHGSPASMNRICPSNSVAIFTHSHICVCPINVNTFIIIIHIRGVRRPTTRNAAVCF